MKISSTGNGLNILIVCDYVSHHDWMSFLSWYSFSKNLPDAQVGIVCNRQVMNLRLFVWPARVKVKFDLHTPTDKENQVKRAVELGFLSMPLVVVEPGILAVRQLEEGSDFLEYIQNTPKGISDRVWVVNDVNSTPVEFFDAYCHAKEDKISTFVSIENGWGKFVTESWINKLNCPFTSFNRYGHGNMTLNESRIGKLWSGLVSLFQTVNRG
jgi:hypothetical protein